MIPTVLIKDVLVAAGICEYATATAWSLWIGKQPGNPIKSVTLYDTGGLAPNPKWILSYPSVQGRVRGNVNDYEAAYNKAQEVFNYLVGIESQDVGVDRLVSITAIGDVSYVGRNDSDCPEFVFNLRLIVEPQITTVTNREPL